MKTYVVLQTTWGGFLVHSEGCPIISRDDVQHANGNKPGQEMARIEVSGPTSKYDLAEQVKNAMEDGQALSLFSKRFIYHSLTENKINVCEAEYLP